MEQEGVATMFAATEARKQALLPSLVNRYRIEQSTLGISLFFIFYRFFLNKSDSDP